MKGIIELLCHSLGIKGLYIVGLFYFLLFQDTVTYKITRVVIF